MWVGGRGWEWAGRIGGEGGGSGRGKVNPTSTADAVDVGFKLRSHAHSPSSILTRDTPIRFIFIHNVSSIIFVSDL